MPGSSRLIGCLAPVGLLAASLAACGSTAAPDPVPPGAASQMHARLAQVSRAAGGGDRSAAISALAAFAADVHRQRSAGHLTGSEYSALQTGIARARRRITAALRAPSAPGTTTSTATSSTATSSTAASTTTASVTSTRPAVTSSPSPPSTRAPGKQHAKPKPSKPPGGGHGEKPGHGHGKH